ncbi:MAG: Cof-type HAD-IIB family hydrolase [Nostoc sp.]
MVAFDMDGTLLNKDHQLSERTIASVKMAAQANLIVLLATGRMTSAVKNHLEKLGTPKLIVTHNGALVKDLDTGVIYHHQTISKRVVIKLLELLNGLDTVVHFNFDDDIYLVRQHPYSELYSQELQVNFSYVPSFNQLEGEPTTIVLTDKKAILVSLLEKLSKQFKQDFSSVIVPWKDGIWRMQFLPANTSKGKAVLQVAHHFGIHPEEIISFGDNYNDIEMVTETGLGIAMANAVPELKQVADFVTVSNQEDGVAHVLEALLSIGKVWRK